MIRRYQRNRRKVNWPGAPLPRMSIVVTTIVDDSLSILLLTVLPEMVIEAGVVLVIQNSSGIDQAVMLSDANATPSSLLTFSTQSGDPVTDGDFLIIPAWHPGIRGTSGEWLGPARQAIAHQP